MPSKSKAQQRLFQMAEHHPSALPASAKGLAKLPHKTLHEFASGPMKGKPTHVSHKKR